jgi:outer membrane protein OmpA-like peptidoglycan-associated protein
MKNAISDRIKETLATTVTVRGYTDRSGSRDYNRLLAERRAAAVAEAIKDTGIKPEIDSVSFGEDRPAVQTADGVREWENRRVTVTLKR